MERAVDTFKEEHPYFSRLIADAPDLAEARRAARRYLAKVESPLRSTGYHLPGVDASIARECLTVLGDVFSERGEAIAGSSALGTLKRVLAGGEESDAKPALIEDLRHLLAGAQGKAGAGRSEKPSYLENDKAGARSRQAYLARLARRALEAARSQASGLDRAVRSELAKHATITSSDWKEQLRARITEPAELASMLSLSIEEQKGVEAAHSQGLGLAPLPWIAALLSLGETASSLKAACLPTQREATSYDKSMERLPRLTRTGPGTFTLRLFRSRPFWQARTGGSTPEPESLPVGLEKLLDRLNKERDAVEVRVAGGEPMFMRDEDLFRLLHKLADIDWVERIVVKTRALATLPARFDRAFCTRLKKLTARVDVHFSARFSCGLEVTHETLGASKRLLSTGARLHGKVWLESHASSRFKPLALRRALCKCGFSSCNFQIPGENASGWRRVPIARAVMESEEEARLIPKVERLGHVTIVTSGGDARTLSRRRNRQVVGILPDGSRVYEILPRDMELAAARTRRYIDVPILDYLQRLSVLLGESPDSYCTIWFYF